MKVAIIGGGAAGFFSAISCKQHHPKAKVVIYEKSQKVLSKVRISGGGRCNVTHACFNTPKLLQHYPRGNKLLKQAFRVFDCSDTIDWFQSRGVPLKTEDDGRMFPTSDDSSSIINVLESSCEKFDIAIKRGHDLQHIEKTEYERFELRFGVGRGHPKLNVTCDKVIVAAGGYRGRESFPWLDELDIKIVEPVPSLFTFHINDKPFQKLMGLTVPMVKLKVVGEKLSTFGPLLITHWGVSGPSVLKLSAFGARMFAERNYKFTLQVNWLNQEESEFRQLFATAFSSRMLLRNYLSQILPKRLVSYLLKKTDLDPEKEMVQMSKKEKNKLINLLTNDQFQVVRKSTFKDEFVTAGGVDLGEIFHKTMECKKVKGLYFAGEILDIDGVTGGFNFQSAWTTAFIAGKLA